MPEDNRIIDARPTFIWPMLKTFVSNTVVLPSYFPTIVISVLFFSKQRDFLPTDIFTIQMKAIEKNKSTLESLHWLMLF